MRNFFKLTTDRYPPASLGCGTLIVIALIIWIISNAGYQNSAEKLTSLSNQVEELEKVGRRADRSDSRPQGADSGTQFSTHSPGA